MIKKTVMLCLGLLALMTFSQLSIAAAPANSCVMCHTNESLMKAMHKPPELPKSAGEG